MAPQFTNSGEYEISHSVPLGSHQYPNIGDVYGAPWGTNTSGALQYANNGESSYGAQAQFDTQMQLDTQAQFNTQADLGLQQYPNNPLLAQNLSDLPVGDNNTLGQSGFDEQAQRQFDNNFNVNDMFSDNAQVPDRPPTNYGFGSGTFADYDNDDNSQFNPWYTGPPTN